MKNRRLEDFKIGMQYEELEFDLTYIRTEIINNLEFDIFRFDGLILNLNNQMLELYFNADVLMNINFKTLI